MNFSAWFQKFLEKLHWEAGRQNTGYEKATFVELPFADLHLLRFKKGCYIPPHVDEVDGRSHYRVNIVLLQDELVDPFFCDICILNKPRLKIFRPDLHTHGVNTVTSTRLVLSFGVAFKKKRNKNND